MLHRWLHGLRERIAGTFNEVQNTERNLEGLLRKTVLGLTTHVICAVALASNSQVPHMLSCSYCANTESDQGEWSVSSGCPCRHSWASLLFKCPGCPPTLSY